jgi:hypothetical protein
VTPTSAAASLEPACAPTQAEIHRVGWLPVDAHPSADARVTGPVPAVPAAGPLPRAQGHLAVTARPGPGVGGVGRAAACLPRRGRQPGAAVPDPW